MTINIKSPGRLLYEALGYDTAELSHETEDEYTAIADAFAKSMYEQWLMIQAACPEELP